MLKETEELIGFFVKFLSLAAFRLGGGAAPWAPAPCYGYAASQPPPIKDQQA